MAKTQQKVDTIAKIYVASAAGEQAALASARDDTSSRLMERDNPGARRRPYSWCRARCSHDSALDPLLWHSTRGFDCGDWHGIEEREREEIDKIEGVRAAGGFFFRSGQA